MDSEYGGFLCDFDRAWQPCGPQEKLLEFQARQTWFAADALRYDPDNSCLQRATTQGFRFLCDVMWDDSTGGWFHRTDRAGKPLEMCTKHVHGIAYAIAACSAVHAATHDPRALELAQQGFAWLERYAHDKSHGGYYGFLKQDGSVIRDKSESPLPGESDAIDTPVGLKDLNVHSDLLESFTCLFRVWNDPILRQRLNEIVDIICRKMLIQTGAIFFLSQSDWTPVPHVMRYPNAFQTAHRLLTARDITGGEEKIIGIAQRMIGLMLLHAWDRRAGGIFFAGPATFPIALEGHDLVVRRKTWWGQFETLKALLLLSCLVEENDVYLRHFGVQWRYVKNYLIDVRYGGVFTRGTDSLPLWRRRLGARFAPSDYTRKGFDWKDASHEGRVYLFCLSVLDAEDES